MVPFGIESGLGFGGVLPTGDLFAVCLFSRVPISRTTAELFRPLALHVKLAVLPFDGGPVFAPADSAAAAGDDVTSGDRTGEDAGQLRSRAAALEQLLEVHERSVQKQAGVLEHALAEARQLLELAPDPIVITDALGRVVRLNRRAEAAFGYSREELLGRPAELLVPGGFRPREGASSANSGQGAGPWPRDLRPDLYGQRKDGSRFPVDLTLSPLEEVGGPLAIGIIRDNTAGPAPGWPRSWPRRAPWLRRRRSPRPSRGSSRRLARGWGGTSPPLGGWTPRPGCCAASRPGIGRRSRSPNSTP